MLPAALIWAALAAAFRTRIVQFHFFSEGREANLLTLHTLSFVKIVEEI